MAAKLWLLVCALHICACLVAGRMHRVPTVRMETAGGSSCPSEANMDAVRSQLSDKISSLVQDIACGGPGWKRVAFLNMTDQNQSCPDQWRLYQEGSLRLCGRPVEGAGCNSVLFSTEGLAYTRVCGRVTGYQYASPDASAHIEYDPTPGNAINEPYLDGVSITYGIPRQHIWSLYGSTNAQVCCDVRHTSNREALGFIGNNSFCDTGNPENRRWQGALFTYHPLWEGVTNCVGSTTCCTDHAGPWFHTALDLPSLQDIEVRICADQHTNNEDTPVELVEIYVR